MSVPQPLAAHSRIDMQDEAERAFWCGFFGATEEQLLAAVAEVGPFVASLDHYFELGDLMSGDSEPGDSSRAA
jgi:hypothetical protein